MIQIRSFGIHSIHQGIRIQELDFISTRFLFQTNTQTSHLEHSPGLLAQPTQEITINTIAHVQASLEVFRPPQLLPFQVPLRPTWTGP